VGSADWWAATVRLAGGDTMCGFCHSPPAFGDNATRVWQLALRGRTPAMLMSVLNA
jgi:cytochrome c553